MSKLKIDFKAVLFIVLVSSALGLIINYLNPNPLPWIKEERKIVWAKDSLNVKSEQSKEGSSITENKKDGSREPVAITLKQAYQLYKKKVLFVDARDYVEFEISHIKGAISLPYYDFDKYKSVLDTIPKQTQMIAYCDGKECDLSIMLSDKLYEAGYGEVYIFFGGWIDWQDNNYPIESNE